MKRKHPCNGCRFYFGAYTKFCNYIFLIGHRRPCPPGKGCTAKEPVDKQRSRT